MKEAILKIPSTDEVLTNLAERISPLIQGRASISRHEVYAIMEGLFKQQIVDGKKSVKRDYLYFDNSSPYFTVSATWSYGSVTLKAKNKSYRNDIGFGDSVWEADTSVHNDNQGFYAILSKVSGVEITETPSRFSLLKAAVKKLRGKELKASKYCSYSHNIFSGFHLMFGFCGDDPVRFAFADIYHGIVKNSVFWVGGDEAIGLAKRITGVDPIIETHIPTVPNKLGKPVTSEKKETKKQTKPRYRRGDQMAMF